MDAFEALLGAILQRQGYWVRSSVRVELTKAEKRSVGRPSTPRWEIDLVAYKGRSNELRVVECKSFLDSRGVLFRGLTDPICQSYKRFKLFNDARLRQTVLRRLTSQLVEEGACGRRPKVRLCLAAGHVASDRDRERIKAHFKQHKWLFWDESWLAEQLAKLSGTGYQNDVASVVAKIVQREK